ncbi:winged helix-turn-helix transcriptional regulator [Nocardia sp. NPDC004722]
MTRRSYDQFCGLAGALDLVGERWTLLVVRELMTGPKRYSDLAEALTGIGTSLLATRLKQLEADGVVTRTYLPPPIASTVYALSEGGEELARALMPLALWGVRYAVPETPSEGMRVKAEWALLAFTHLADPAALAGLDLDIAFEVEGSRAYLRLRDGRVRILPGTETVTAATTVRTDAATLAALGAGRLPLPDALARGLVQVEGDAAALAPLITALGELA